MRDINLEDTIYRRFTTRAFATGIPTTLAGTPVLSVYEENNLTQITAGVSVSVDYDAVTGLNQATIVATAANGYEAGKSYDLVITTGTVDGASVVGVVVFSFTVEDSAIGLNATARAALEDQYDGTGLTGDPYPATQAQAGNIATGSAAISVVASSSVLTTGSEVNTYTSTFTKDAVYNEVSDAAGVMEVYYEFDVGGNGVASEVSMWGRLVGANDTIGVYAYNWAATSWDQIDTIVGSNGGIDGFLSFNLLNSHTGTGANLGLVRVRGYAASGLTSATLFIDQAYVSFAIVAQSVGYANGAIWVDTTAGTAGTEVYVNGVADNPCLTLADANTIDGVLGLDRFELSPDTAITFVGSQANQLFDGKSSTIVLGGQDLTGTTMIGAHISGVGTKSGDELHFIDCEINAVTIHGAHLQGCGITSTITAGEASTYTLQTCHSEVAGTGSPIFDFAAVGNVALNVRRYSGGLEVQNMTAGDTMSFDAVGALTINANCTGGIIVRRGDMSFVDNSGGAVTVTSDDNTTNTASILEDTADMQPKLGTPVADISADIAAVKTDTDTNLPGLIDDLAIKKNTALPNFEFLMVLALDHVTPATGLTITAYRSIDGGAFTLASGVTAEVSNGIYQFDALAADTNGDIISWRFSAGTADDTFITFKTVA